MAARPPSFYTQITFVKETFQTSQGLSESVDLPLITLPAGTVLFRGIRMDQEDPRYFYRDFLGDPEGPTNMCLSPTHNVFFYPFPYVPFGVHQVGSTFQAIQIVVLVHSATVVCSIRPSPMVRGTALRYSGNAPYQRCSKLNYDCHPLTPKELEAKSFDNCLLPDYQVRSGTRGWMAIADLDSLNPKNGENAPMKSYLLEMEEKQPGSAKELLSWAYLDQGNHAGYPEIALYPYKKHQGSKPLVRSCPTHEAALKWIAYEAEHDNLMYLPLATVTKDGVIDMVTGHFDRRRTVSDKDSFVTPSAASLPSVQNQIEKYTRNFVTMAQTTDMVLPFYGKGKLCFDTRTGFYVLKQILPRSVMIPVPDEVKQIPYSFLTMPLDTEDARRRAMEYMILFRTFLPNVWMTKFGLDKGVGVRRAMVFERPPLFYKLFEDLKLSIPANIQKTMQRGSTLYKKNTGTLAIRKPTPKPLPALIGPTTPPMYGTTTPPMYGATTPQSGGTNKHPYANSFANVWKIHKKNKA